ncbi:hypothetical protein B7463_g4621, partial [Scytalidium lignicola]
MESLHKEAQDSRASEVGRKRTLQEPLASSREVIALDSSDGEDEVQPQQKRAKHSHDLQAVSPPSQDATIQTEAANRTSVAASSVLPRVISWNQGVQSGLRTSFGNRNKGPPSVAAVDKPDDGAEDDGLQPNQTNAPPTAETRNSEHPTSKDAMLKAKKKHKLGVQMDQMEAETKNATVAFQNFGLPLPPHCQPIIDKIAGGLTLYPKRLDSTPVYVNKSGEFRLQEALDNGRPVSIKDLNLNLFTLAFLQGNPDKLESIKAKQLGAAYSIYVLKYYPHIHPTFRDPIISTQSHHSLELVAILRQARKELKESKKKNAPSKGGTQPPKAIPESRETQNDVTHEVLRTNANDVDVQISRGNNTSHKGEDIGENLHEDFRISEEENMQPLSSMDPSIPSGGITTQATVVQPASIVQTSHQTPNVADGEVFVVDAAPAEIEFQDDGSNAASVGESDAIKEYDEVEYGILQRYFPATGSTTNPPRCLSCAGNDHCTIDCDAFTCATCGVKGEHTTISCPQNQRCGKCRQLGHVIFECPEKLRISKDERPGCDICKSTSHVETGCSFIWRSFRIKPEEVKKVNSILVYCHCCGNIGHYGGECGLRKRSIPSGGFTWSKSNLAMYLDPSSANQALSAAVDYSIPTKSQNGLSIKGKGGRPHDRERQTIVIDDSDDDVSTFIRPKVSNAPLRMGGIHIVQPSRSSNANANVNANANNPSYWAPPATYHARDNSARYGHERTFSPPPRYNEPPNYQPRAMDMNYNSRPHRGQSSYSSGWTAQGEQHQRNAFPPPPSNTIRGDDGAPRAKKVRIGKRTRRNREKAERDRIAATGR